MRFNDMFCRSSSWCPAVVAALVIGAAATPASAHRPSADGLPAPMATGKHAPSLPGNAPRLGALPLALEGAADATVRAPRGAARCLPFHGGEELTYVLEWMGIDVGRAVFRVDSDGRFAGKPSWHFHMEARTTSWADKVYRVRDVLDAWADAAMQRAVHHTKIAREGSYHRDIQLTFDWKRLLVIYQNQWRSYPAKALHTDTWDPLGLLYAFRMRAITAPGRTELSVSDGLKTIRAQVRVHGREFLDIGGKRIAAWRVEPQMQDVGGIFERSPGARMEIWVSDDGRHLPLKLRSAVIVGSFTGTLISAKGLAPDRPGCRLDRPDGARPEVIASNAVGAGRDKLDNARR